MTFWDWAGAAWSRPGVDAAFLSLQDVHGQCVPLLLWALWRLETNGGVGADAADDAASLCRWMDETVIGPLRAARRDAAVLDRERLLANELKAEHELIDRLEGIGAYPAGDAKSAPGKLLSMISVRWGRPLAPGAFDDLLGALAIQEPADVG